MIETPRGTSRGAYLRRRGRSLRSIGDACPMLTGTNIPECVRVTPLAALRFAEEVCSSRKRDMWTVPLRSRRVGPFSENEIDM